MLSPLLIILQLSVAFGLLNVWILRFNKATAYRGGNADSLRSEFAAYGLPPVFVYIIGGLKIGSAIALIAGIWIGVLVLPASLLVSFLMLGAILMHLKIKDPLKKSIPALLMLALSLGIAALSSGAL
jgi:hypothetical protein